MRIEVAEEAEEPPAEILEDLLAWLWIPGILPVIVEQNPIHEDCADHAPLQNLCPPVPRRSDVFEFMATLELPLEPELLFLGQVAKGRRPFLLCRKAIAGEVEGWERVFFAAE